jgi:hypothetical protein
MEISMKKNPRVSYIFLLIMPVLILLAAFGLDKLEAAAKKEVWKFFNPEGYLWMMVFIRLVFALMVFAGICFLLRQPKKARILGIVWLGLGILAAFLTTPFGNLVRSVLIHTPSLATFPGSLFFMAGAFLIIAGGYILIQSSRDKGEGKQN